MLGLLGITRAGIIWVNTTWAGAIWDRQEQTIPIASQLTADILEMTLVKNAANAARGGVQERKGSESGPSR